LRYGDHEAQVEVPLEVDIPEVLRRVQLKNGPTPVDEAACQIADILRSTIYDQRLLRRMVKDIIQRL
jgi:hypothetical protein